VAEPGAVASVARKALAILHLDVEDTALPGSIEGLVDEPDTACVAGCYRCLLSYYNQPDHELLDRRNEAAREILLRLARATMHGVAPTGGDSAAPVVSAARDDLSPQMARWFEQAATLGLPGPDTRPIVSAAVTLDLVWRNHYVAATVGEAPAEAVAALADQGFEIIAFAADEARWSESFAVLARHLGRAS